MPYIPNPSQPLWKKLWPYLVPFAVAWAVPLIIPGYFATPVVLRSCAVRQATVSQPGESLRVEQFQSIAIDGTVLQDVVVDATFCDRTLALGGTAADVPAGMVLRLFNVTDAGKAFVHEPALDVINGRWHTSKVGPGSNIREIRFVRVGESDSRAYSAAAARGDWGPHTLPAQAQTVASIHLEPLPVCTQLDARQCPPVHARGTM